MTVEIGNEREDMKGWETVTSLASSKIVGILSL